MMVRRTAFGWLSIVLALAGALALADARTAGASGDSGHDAPAGSPADPVFLPMRPFLAPVLEGRRIDRYVHLSITLELVNEDVEDQVERRLTPLRNAFIQDLHFQAHMHDESGRDVHLHRIKARFQMLADRVLGVGTVREILITEVIERSF